MRRYHMLKHTLAAQQTRLIEMRALCTRMLRQTLSNEQFAKVVASQKAWAERVAYYDLLNAADYKLAYDHYFPGKLSL